MPTTPLANGNANSFFIAEVRRILRDQAAWFTDSIPTDATNGVVNVAGAKPFRLQRAPVVTAGAVITGPGGSPVVVYDVAPASSAQVEIVSDTGEVIFFTAPASGTLSATYQSFRYSDAQILDALTEGLKAMWPQIWQEQSDTSLTPTPYAFEYTLPTVFNDPRVEIVRIEIRDPNVIVIPYRQVERYERVSQNTIQLTDLRYSPAGNIRISYNAPYLLLSDPEPQVMHLPVYYAVGRLLADQEAMRSRQDELVPLVGEGGSQSGVAQQTSTYWFSLYEREKQRYARPLPLRSLKQFDGWSYGDRVNYRTRLG
jgi:hypothetical protein